MHARMHASTMHSEIYICIYSERKKYSYSGDFY